MTPKERYSLCASCPYSVKHSYVGLSCGPLDLTTMPPVIGKTIIEEDVNGVRTEIKLCGCLMKYKTRIKFFTCPAGRWK